MKLPETNPFFDEVLLPIYRAVQFDQDGRGGVLTASSEALLHNLQRVTTDEGTIASGIALEVGEPDSLAVGQVVRVRISPPRPRYGALANDFSDVLRFPEALWKCARFFLRDKRLAYRDEEIKRLREFQYYEHLVDFVTLLQDAATYSDRERSQIVFVGDTKVVVNINCDLQVLLAMDTASFGTLASRINTDTHKEQKLAILAEAVVELCIGVEPRIRFERLLSQGAEILKAFDEGYRLFAADFSYEKVKDKLQAEKIEELTKIHKTFADVQSQILAIPVATVLVATQLKATTVWDSTAWTNLAILAGVWVFTVLMYFLIRNQRSTLDAIDEEIKRKQAKVLQDYAAVADLVGSIFPALHARLLLQKRAFCAVLIVVGISAALAHVAFFALTDPARGLMSAINYAISRHLMP